MVQGRFREPLSFDDVVTGQAFRRLDNLPARWVIDNVVLRAARAVNPRCVASYGCIDIRAGYDRDVGSSGWVRWTGGSSFSTPDPDLDSDSLSTSSFHQQPRTPPRCGIRAVLISSRVFCICECTPP